MTARKSIGLAALAEFVNGTLVGDASVVIEGAAPLDEATAGTITFVDQPERLGRAEATDAAALVLPEGVHSDAKPAIIAADVHTAFTKIAEHFAPEVSEVAAGVSPEASVSPTAKLGHEVTVGPGASIADEVVIGDRTVIHSGVRILPGSEIGADVEIFPNAVLYQRTKVGDRTIIHSGAVLGAYGFGYRQQEGQHQLTAQIGNVEIGCDVEVGANTTIDRGTYSSTRIGDGTKIDNLVQIGHNCQIGKHNLLCAQVGIAGSTSTGDYVVMAGQVGVRDHVHIGRGARIGAMAGVSNDIAEGISAFGAPAIPEREQKVLLASLAKLPEMRKQFKQLTKLVDKLEQEVDRQAGGGPTRAVDEAA